MKQQLNFDEVCTTMTDMFTLAIDNVTAATLTLPSRQFSGTDVLTHLMGHLHTPYDQVTPADTCVRRGNAAAELAYTLTVTLLVHPDLADVLTTPGTRIVGDRGVSDMLVRALLRPHRIPCTGGALQSSTYRSGYTPAHTKDHTLTHYLHWVANATHDDRRTAAMVIGEQFTRHRQQPATATPAHAWTAAQFTAWLHTTAHTPSNGAGAQYVTAALLTHMYGPTVAVETKPVFAPDHHDGADIIVTTPGHNPQRYEISTRSWVRKLDVFTGTSAADVLIAGEDPTIPCTATGWRSAAAERHVDLPAHIHIHTLSTYLPTVASLIPAASYADVVTTFARLVAEHAPHHAPAFVYTPADVQTDALV